MLRCLLVRWYEVWDLFYNYSRGEGQVMIKGIGEIRLAVNWLLKLGDGYVGVHHTGFSNKYFWLFHNKKQKFLLKKH